MKPTQRQLTALLLGIFVLACLPARGQGLGLFAFKTNVLEWGVAVPNVSAFTDVSAKPWNRSAVGLTVKYKWKTAETHAPSLVFNLFEIRPEYRHYRKNFYLGVYAAYDSYATKLPAWESVQQGKAWGAGASAGWELPLYTYTRGSLDLDVGASVGAHYAGGTVVPYPEFRVALTWRKTSIAERYRENNPMDAVYEREKEAIDINFGVSRPDSFENLKPREEFRSAYLAEYREFLQESFVQPALEAIERSALDQRHKKRLLSHVEKLTRQAMAEAEKSLKGGVK